MNYLAIVYPHRRCDRDIHVETLNQNIKYFYISDGINVNIEKLRGVYFSSVVFHPEVDYYSRKGFLEYIQPRIK